MNIYPTSNCVSAAIVFSFKRGMFYVNKQVWKGVYFDLLPICCVSDKIDHFPLDYCMVNCNVDRGWESVARAVNQQEEISLSISLEAAPKRTFQLS